MNVLTCSCRQVIREDLLACNDGNREENYADDTPEEKCLRKPGRENVGADDRGEKRLILFKPFFHLSHMKVVP